MCAFAGAVDALLECILELFAVGDGGTYFLGSEFRLTVEECELGVADGSLAVVAELYLHLGVSALLVGVGTEHAHELQALVCDGLRAVAGEAEVERTA